MFCSYCSCLFYFNLNQLKSEELQLDTDKTPDKPSAFIQEVADKKPQATQVLRSPLKQGLLAWSNLYILLIRNFY